MALKPPPIGDVFRQVSDLLDSSGLKNEADRNAKAMLQAALARLDVVSREEFDRQADILARTRARVAELEEQLAALDRQFHEIDSQPS